MQIAQKGTRLPAVPQAQSFLSAQPSMKTVVLSALAVFALAFPASAQVPVRPTDVKLEKPAPQVVKTPEIQFQGGSQKRSTPGNWLEVEVPYSTVPEMIDELTFTYKIVINKKLLVGEVTHVNIPKGREHFSVMYVSPGSLTMVMGGKALSAGAIEGVWVEISKQGQVLGTESTTKGPVPNLPQVAGAVLKKPETPFAPLYWDRYEAMKAAR